MKAAAIVQARMGSTRMPGKVLAPVCGRPLLWHVVHRLRKSAHIGAICVATSTEAADDVLAAFALTLGVKVVRGPEDDVLGRFLMAAQELDASVLVRVCADSPLVDPALADRLIETMIARGADYVTLPEGAECIHEGVDVFSRAALEKLAAEARDDAFAREHVTGYFKAHPDFVKTAAMEPPAALAFSGARVSVDTPADVEFIEAAYRKLEAAAGEASLADLVALLRRDPALLAINARVRRKAAGAASGVVVLRCDGGGALGYGHVKRCLALARELRDGQGLGCVFAMQGDGDAVRLVRAEGFAVETLGENEEAALSALIARQGPLAIVFDIRTPLSREAVARLRGPLIVMLDDASERRHAADLVFYPPTARAKALTWESGAPLRCIGWEYAILGAEIAPRVRGTGRPRALVSMGGSDPWGWTLPCIAALAPLDCELTVVIGPGFAEPGALAKEIAKLRADAEIARAPQSLAPFMARADLAVAAFGVTAYELAAHGVPAVYLAPTDDHADSARAFAEAGFGVLAALDGVAREAGRLLGDGALRRRMGAAAMQAIDGGGAARVAAQIAGSLNPGRRLQAAQAAKETEASGNPRLARR